MEANLTPVAPATEPPPESATTPKTPTTGGEALAQLMLSALGDDPRAVAALGAIDQAREAAHTAAILSMEADKAEAAAVVASKAGNEAGRKADAKLASSALRLRAEHAQIDAQAAARLVDLLVPRAMVLR